MSSGWSRNRLLIIGAAALLVAAVSWGIYHASRSDSTGALELHGNVDIRSVDLGFRVAGRIATVPFEEGSRVKAGDVLATLDDAPLRASFAMTDANVASTLAEYEKRRRGNRPQEIDQARAKHAEARAALARARADYDRRAELVKTGAVSQALFAASEEQYRAAQAQAAAAREALSLQQAGARREDIDAADALHRQAAAQRDRAQSDLADAVLRAPNDGVILTRAREPGAIVAPGESVLTLTIDRPMRIRAYVDEPDLGRISPGMCVSVTADGNAKSYRGTVGYIAPTAEFTPKTVQTEDLRTDLVYRIRVIVSDPDDALRQGAPVTVAVTNARSQSP